MFGPRSSFFQHSLVIFHVIPSLNMLFDCKVARSVKKVINTACGGNNLPTPGLHSSPAMSKCIILFATSVANEFGR